MYTPQEIRDITIQSGVKKIEKTLEAKLILGFIGGAMIALGYLAYIRIAGPMAEKFGGLSSFIGACIFPVGLMVILLAGGELITGNMMVVSMAFLDKKVTFKELCMNWLTITFANVVGALFVAYVFGHLTGLMTSGVYLHEVEVLTQSKLAASSLQCFLSGIGCNWFVGIAVFLCYGARDGAAKFIAIWFPVMTFVVIGFQHSVANMFLIPMAIFEGQATIGDLLANVIPVYGGNIVGAVIFISLFYYRAYK